MGTSLTGVNISSSYLGLLKSTDSLAISTSAKRITDGAGNDLPIKLSTNQMLFNAGTASAPALSFDGNLSEGFFLPTDENIGVAIAGSEVARFLSTGLSLTSSKLTLSNDQKVRWTSDDVYIQGTTASDNIQLGVGGSTQFTFAQTTGMRLHQYGSGNITGTVTQRLGVTSAGQVVEIPIGSGAVDGSGTAGKIVKWSDSDTITNSIISESGSVITIGDGSASEIALAFDSSATDFALGANGSNFMIGTSSDLDSGNLITLSSAGNFGIGTTSPNARLEISDSTNDNLRIGTRGGNINIFSVNDAGATAPLRLEASQFDFINGNATFAGNVTINTTGQGLKVSTAAGQSHLQFTDSTNSKNSFINYDNDVLKYFSNGPSEQFSISSTGATFAGNVTLSNASSPKISITDTSQTTTLQLYSQDSNSHIGTATNHPLIIDTNNSEVARFTNAGELLKGITSAVGVGGTPADANSTEIGNGYIILSRDDTADAKQISFGKNGAEHSFLQTTSSGLTIGGANVTFAGDIFGNDRLYLGTKMALDVNGTDLFVGSTTSADHNDTVNIRTNDDNRVIITDTSSSFTNSVGVGTTSPVGTLSVITATAGENVFRAEGVAGRLFIDHAGAGNNLYDAANHKFRDFAGNEHMRISSAGKVAIGSTNPAGLFNVSNGGANGLEIDPSQNSGATTLLQSYNRSGSAYTLMRMNSSSYEFQIADSTKMSIDSSGGVIFKGALASHQTNAGAIEYFSNQTSFKTYGATSNVGFFTFHTGGGGGSAGSERIRITSGGSLCVNTTDDTPNGVSTSASIVGYNNGSRFAGHFATATSATSTALVFSNTNGLVGSVETSGTSTSYNTSSDYRLKEDLQDFNALEIASKIKMYDFKWKSDDSRSYGVMAHELQEVVPQAVSGDKDAEDMQQVDYSKLVPILLKSIQELEARVKELEKEI